MSLYKKVKGALTPKQCYEIINLWRVLPNTVTIHGEVKDRHSAGIFGHCMTSDFTLDEWAPYDEDIRKAVGVPFEMVYVRLLKYSRTCFMPNHVDNHYEKPWQPFQDLSIIIQLNDPEEYEGGRLLVDGEDSNLEQGDIIIWSYDLEKPHEITPVSKGKRYSMNLRGRLL